MTVISFGKSVIKGGVDSMGILEARKNKHSERRGGKMKAHCVILGQGNLEKINPCKLL